MAVEHVIDLGRQRYADREYEGILPEPAGPSEEYQRDRREKALARLRRRVRRTAGAQGQAFLDRSVLTDLLIVLGEAGW
jgi:hypothetical protein